ncbi:MAG: phosphogluconate dehydrogenase C-terminal domain-containing protein [Anaerolineae bacterium]|nr:NAD(P)-binding domain-containing protein [Candidatus Roseilinea sp.]MDW8450547.1 phosphogluconate dehydrogenase C-terminal domain-containing protein [Anaerolineae bacterium]
MRLTLMGAGGKMGCRIADNLMKRDDFDVRYVEVSPAGIERLAQRGLSPTPQAEALAHAEAVILAVPDALLGKITHDIVPSLAPGTLVITLDPAAAYAGALAIRDDLDYFITHPCHPPLFNDEVDEAARTDWFGGVKAKQHIVCALHHGCEEAYATGEYIARAIYAPVMNAYRVTTEQMALLEPALVETTAGTCIAVMKEAYDAVVAMGVPAEAAYEFLSGHVRTLFASIFGVSGFPLSDGANYAIAQAKRAMLQPDWKAKVLSIERVRRSVAEIAHTVSET